MNHPFLILGNIINKYTTIDFSETNNELSNVQLNNPYQCQEYIETILNKTGCQIAYGGYLEKRNLYNESSLFSLIGLFDLFDIITLFELPLLYVFNINFKIFSF